MTELKEKWGDEKKLYTYLIGTYSGIDGTIGRDALFMRKKKVPPSEDREYPKSKWITVLAEKWLFEKKKWCVDNSLLTKLNSTEFDLEVFEEDQKEEFNQHLSEAQSAFDKIHASPAEDHTP